MKQICSLFLSALIFTNIAVGRSGSWVKTYGGSGYDAAISVAQLNDGTYVVAGETSSTDGNVKDRKNKDEEDTDWWILRLDASGKILQRRSLGGAKDERVPSVAATRDGGYIIAGASFSSDGDVEKHIGGSNTSNFWVVKFTSGNEIQWQKSLGGTQSSGYKDDFDMVSVVEASDGYVVAGNSFANDGNIPGDHHSCKGTRDIVLIKLNPEGKVRWAKSYGGSNHEYLSQVSKTKDHEGEGYIFVGRTESGNKRTKEGVVWDGDVHGFIGEFDAWVVKVDGNGKVQWQKTIGGSEWDWGSSVVQTSDGGYVFGGYAYSSDGDAVGNHGDYDYLVLKLRPDGTTQWRQVFGGSQVEFGHSIIELNDGSLFMVGNTTSASTTESDGDVRFRHGNPDADEHDIWAIRIDSSGKNVTWQKSFGGSDGYNLNGLGASVIQTEDGDVVIVGTTSSTDGDIPSNHGDYDYLVIKISAADLAKDEGLKPARTRRRGIKRSIPKKAGRTEGVQPAGLSVHKSARKSFQISRTNNKDRATMTAPQMAWQKTFGGSKPDRAFESPQALVKKRKGGFLLIGSTQSSDGDVSVNRGDWDVFVANVTESGKTLWKRTYGGSGKDIGVAIAEDRDGGIVFVATTDSVNGDVGGPHGMEDIWVVKLSPESGDIVKKKTLGGSAPDLASSIIATEDDNGEYGYLVGGTSQSRDGDVKHAICAYDYWVVKLDRDLNVKWEKSYGGTSNDYLSQVIQTQDGGYAAMGRTESDDVHVKKNHGTYDYWLVKFGPKGDLEWSRNYGSWDWDWGTSLAQTHDGGFVLAGYIYGYPGGDVSSTQGEHDYWVVKVNEAGDIEWDKSYGGTKYDIGYGIIETSDGGYAMVGGAHSDDGQVTGNHGNSDVWVIKINKKGKLLWEKSLGGSDYEFGYAIVEAKDKGLVILGETFSNDGDVSGLHGNEGDEDIWMVKLFPEGKKVQKQKRNGI